MKLQASALLLFLGLGVAPIEVGATNSTTSANDPDYYISDGPEARIVGGTAAKRGAYKFYAKWSGCGASLIAPDVLLTAAHVRTTDTLCELMFYVLYDNMLLLSAIGSHILIYSLGYTFSVTFYPVTGRLSEHGKKKRKDHP